MSKYKDKVIVGLFSLFILCLFYYITKLTPLAGDDWGYAVNGLKGNPFYNAFSFYFTWSGRFFSELWGFIVAPNRWIWNIINPIIFLTIFLSIINLFRKNDNFILICLVVLFLMLSVQNTLRIETYTWLMGTTYVIPLMLILIYINFIKNILIYNKVINNLIFVLVCFVNFYIGLCMENIAASLLLLNILVCIYVYFNNKEVFKKFILLFFISLISLILLRVSPGANYRLYRDNLEWINYGIFKQISINYINFLNLTFIKNNYLLLLFNIVFLGLNFKLFNKKQKISILFMLFNIIGIFISLCEIMYLKTNVNFLRIFYDVEYSKTAFVFVSIFYLLMIIFTFISLYKNDLIYEGGLYFVLAGASNIVMLISPIFGARSSIYTVYFIILLISLVISKLDIKFKKIMYILFLFLIFIKTKEYIYKYRMVAYFQQMRNMEIEYYRVNQDVEEAWLIRMPKSFIHSADIEEDDLYHMQVFKEYYGLNPNVKLIFYNKE